MNLPSLVFAWLAGVLFRSNVVPSWTPDEDATLLRMWGAGHSAVEIGEAIGRTRTTVCSRMHRLRQNGVAIIRHPKSPTKRAVPVLLLPAPPAPSGAAPMGIPIDQLTWRSCRWVYEDGTYCGAETQPGRSFCDHHHEICYE